MPLPFLTIPALSGIAGLFGGRLAIPILLAVLGLGGAGVNQWYGWLTTSDYFIYIIAGFFCLYLTVTNNPWAKVLIPAALCIAGYVKGWQDTRTRMIEEHRKAIEFIHETYQAEAESEKRRQVEVNRVALEESERDKLTYFEERNRLRDEVKRLRKEMIDDPEANRPALSADAIRRINVLRHPRRAAVRPGSGKATN